MQMCLLIVLFTTAGASRGNFWSFKTHRPSSGFLGDIPETELQKPTTDIAKMDKVEFNATYKQPRAEKRVSNVGVDVILTVAKEINTTNAMNVTGDGLKIEKTEEKVTVVEKTEEKVPVTTRTREAGLKIMALKEQKEPTLASAAAATEKAETKTEPKSTRSRRGKSREVTLIESLQHMGGDEAVGCVTHCRYDEKVRHPWSECLDRCVENRLMRSAMASMLPQEDHDAHHTEKEVPTQLQEKLERHRQRMEEL